MSKVNLRKEAKGRECQVRIVGVCNGNPETVVLAHYRMGGLNGMGMKPDDIFGAWACSACHDAVDGRTIIGGIHEQVSITFRTRASGFSLRCLCGVWRNCPLRKRSEFL